MRAADAASMIIGVLLLLSLLSVRLLGGRLGALAEVRVRLIGLVVAALAVQVLVINIAPHGSAALHEAAFIGTYAALAAALVANRRLPGIALIALGGACNLAAIVANGGVMPASASALRTAGMTPDPSGYTNSGYVPDAHLALLGDVFATPASWPAANVFSIGDLLLVAGAFILFHVMCRSRLAPLLRPLWRRGTASAPSVP